MLNLREGIDCLMEEINPQEINVDHTYQRTLRKTYKRIKDQFDPLLVGVVTISRRPDGTLWVMDGMHRIQAMKELGITSTKALVYNGLTLEEEAKIFSLQNLNRVRVSPHDIYNASKMIRGTTYYTLHQVATQVGTPIRKITECGPRTIGLYIQKLAQHGAQRTKDVFMVNKLCNKRYDHDLYNEKIQRAIYSKLETTSRAAVIRKINAAESLRALIAQSYAAPLANYGDILDF